MRRLLSLFSRLNRRPALHGRTNRRHHHHAVTLSTRPPNVGRYQVVDLPRLSAAQVRERQFNLVRRHGLDPDEVQSFLHRVATELAAARRELAYTREENDRIKRALRSWQSHVNSRAYG